MYSKKIQQNWFCQKANLSQKFLKIRWPLLHQAVDVRHCSVVTTKSQVTKLLLALGLEKNKFKILPGVVYSSWRFWPMQFTDALNPVVYGFEVSFWVFYALNLHFLSRDVNHILNHLSHIFAVLYIHVRWCFNILSVCCLTVTLCCLLFSDSHRESTVGSDCLVQGSSRTRRPRLSGLPSGRGTCTSK